ncbi:hypothetical protein WR25_00877 [Diploscapter pachys]|uniref:SXP/RAL-2 family protein Ani s 5-like cation-binding domain-containing protein n=1 Tax=Diploscapter pachys TaxID=2018661 RepID=A0A2A2KVL3_9BILA|nr:hypothetical protein WR25_00877 [Diploscapter pachys]
MRASLLLCLGLLALSTVCLAYPAAETEEKKDSSSNSESSEEEGKKEKIGGPNVLGPNERKARLEAEERKKAEAEGGEQKDTQVKPWADKDGKTKIKQLKEQAAEAQAAEKDAEKALLRLRRALIKPEAPKGDEAEEKTGEDQVERRHHRGHHHGRGRHHHRRHHHDCQKFLEALFAGLNEGEKKEFMKIKHDEDLSREEKIEKIRKWAEEKGDLVKEKIEDFIKNKENFRNEKKQLRKAAVKRLPDLVEKIEEILEDDDLSRKEMKEKVVDLLPTDNQKLIEILQVLYPFIDMEVERELDEAEGMEKTDRVRRNIGQGVGGFTDRKHHGIGHGVDTRHHKHQRDDMYDAYGRRKDQYDAYGRGY